MPGATIEREYRREGGPHLRSIYKPNASPMPDPKFLLNILHHCTPLTSAHPDSQSRIVMAAD